MYERRHDDMYSGYKEKRDTSYSRLLEHDSSQQRMKLKDRLNQVRSIEIGVKK